MAVLNYYDETNDKYIPLPIGSDTATFGNYQYGEDEQVVGEWIDGRPMYRKFFDISGAASGGTVNTVGDISYIKDIIYCCAFLYSTEGNTVSSNVYCKKESDTQFKLWCSEGFAGAKHMLVEYTKTTDAENSFTIDMLSSTTISASDEATDDEVSEVLK